LHGVVVTEVQDSALRHLEHHTGGLSPSIQPLQSLSTCYSLAVASNNGPCGRSVTPPSVGVGRRMKETGKNLWVGIRAV